MIKNLLRFFILPAITLFCLGNWNGPLQGAVPLGGLTVAVSSEGTLLVAGGDTRTILVLDPESLEVKERYWLGVSITGRDVQAAIHVVERGFGFVKLAPSGI